MYKSSYFTFITAKCHKAKVPQTNVTCSINKETENISRTSIIEKSSVTLFFSYRVKIVSLKRDIFKEMFRDHFWKFCNIIDDPVKS